MAIMAATLILNVVVAEEHHIQALSVADFLTDRGAKVELLTKAGREITGVDAFVIAATGKADDALYRSIKGEVAEIYAVGHCLAPRKLWDSIWGGGRIGRLL
jgi:hypothetical protein